MTIFKGKKTIIEKVADQEKKLQPEFREMIVGRRTILSLLSFGVGTVLIGNWIWFVARSAIGEFSTGLIGLFLFLTGGVISKQFRR